MSSPAGETRRGSSGQLPRHASGNTLCDVCRQHQCSKLRRRPRLDHLVPAPQATTRPALILALTLTLTLALALALPRALHSRAPNTRRVERRPRPITVPSASDLLAGSACPPAGRHTLLADGPQIGGGWAAAGTDPGRPIARAGGASVVGPSWERTTPGAHRHGASSRRFSHGRQAAPERVSSGGGACSHELCFGEGEWRGSWCVFTRLWPAITVEAGRTTPPDRDHDSREKRNGSRRWQWSIEQT